MSTDAAITVDDVSKRFRLYHERNQSLKATLMRRRRARYEEFWALRDVSLEVAEGTTFGLIGENGSGKSTLLKCMAKILRPDKGSVASRGRMSALLELGAGFHAELSGRENIFLNGSILGLSKKQLTQRFDEIVDFAGLEHFIDTPVKNYSSGMYVRLGFSVAINVDPEILLIDEVLAVGDADFQRKCMTKIDSLNSRGKTIVIVSHGLGSIRNLCDTAALLEHGELRALGPAPEVIDQYLGDLATARPDGELGTRWGEGGAQITTVEVLDASGQDVKRVRTGDMITFRIRYETDDPIEHPAFGFSIFTLDGMLVTGPNTRLADTCPDQIEGTGFVDLHVPRLLLAPGTYDIGVGLHNYTFTKDYDVRHRSFRFEVEHGDPVEDYGVMSLAATWRFPGGAPNGS